MSPVVVSDQLPGGFNASGIVAASANTTGAFFAFVPQYFRVGVRKMPRITSMPTTGAKVGMGVDVGVHARLGFGVRNELRGPADGVSAQRRAGAVVRNITRS